MIRNIRKTSILLSICIVCSIMLGIFPTSATELKGEQNLFSDYGLDSEEINEMDPEFAAFVSELIADKPESIQSLSSNSITFIDTYSGYFSVNFNIYRNDNGTYSFHYVFRFESTYAPNGTLYLTYPSNANIDYLAFVHYGTAGQGFSQMDKTTCTASGLYVPVQSITNDPVWPGVFPVQLILVNGTMNSLVYAANFFGYSFMFWNNSWLVSDCSLN